MLRPTTNSPPMIRIARRTARRSKGSPALRVSLRSQPAASFLMRRIELEHAAGEHEAPGGRIDEQRFRSAGVRRPIAGGELLRDQTIGGRIIRNPQQRLGDAHERDAFLIRQAELLQEGIEERPLVTPGARALDQGDGPRHRPMPRASGEIERVQQARARPGLPATASCSRAATRRLSVDAGDACSLKLATMASFLEKAVG